MTYQVPFTLMTDFYKTGHIQDYPAGTDYIMINGTFRKGRLPDDFGVIWFGFQGAVQKYLVEYAEDTFFSRDVDEVCAEFEAAMLECIGPNTIGSQHWRDLHALGYLPLEIRSLEEGKLVPYGVPCFTIENTLPEFFWLPNWTETLISSAIWQATTSATIAMRYRVLLEDWAEATGVPAEFVDWQGHDFSFRGMSSPESAQFSGAGHLTSFTGTDTIPAIWYLKHYYHSADDFVGGSVAATEHSVMCAGGKDDELETFNFLMDVHPDGTLSVVSDTWNLWNVLTNIARKLKAKIMGRNGKLVFRPDSGDPVKIICGDPDAEPGTPEFKGVWELLYDVFGGTTNEQGYIVLDPHVGAIYGDSINLDRCNRIQLGLAEKGFAPSMVFGIGSFTYQFNTRDTHGFAIKATWSEVNGEEHMLFKDPITDDGMKRSARGRVGVTDFDGEFKLVDGMTKEQNNLLNDKGHNALELVWKDGKPELLITLRAVRDNVKAEVAKRRA